jgi:arylsulfatase A-like enzyme
MRRRRVQITGVVVHRLSRYSGSRIAVAVAAWALVVGATQQLGAADDRPSVLVITVDALRADHLGGYGYERPTSPNIDRLLSDGLHFDRAWTPEPLTGPAMCSMITGLQPQEHAATRNGLRMKPGLDSLPKILAERGWRTAAVVGTWTLKDNLTLLGEHFDNYGERLRRRRWFGILNSEATAEDVTNDALEWLNDSDKKDSASPFFLWVHYIEPHAPYRFHEKYAERLSINDDKLTRLDRYDTEIAAVDDSIGRLLAGVQKMGHDDNLVVVFTADHGESLGEHDYWGHGRYLYEPSLRIPLGISWRGRIPAGRISSQATLLDLAPTLLELGGVDVPEELPGQSWAGTARGGDALAERTMCYQAHRGAVHGGTHDNERKRSKGLLWVGMIEADRKELIQVNRQYLQTFDLGADPGELENLASTGSRPSDQLLACFAEISTGLGALDRLATQKLDDETVEQLKALGYLE